MINPEPPSPATSISLDVDQNSHYRTVRKLRDSGPMARWVFLCCLLVVPLDLLAIFLIIALFPHQLAAMLLAFWLYFYPVSCLLILIGTSAFQTSTAHVPRLIAFAVLAFIAAAINLPVYFVCTFYDRLGPM